MTGLEHDHAETVKARTTELSVRLRALRSPSRFVLRHLCYLCVIPPAASPAEMETDNEPGTWTMGDGRRSG